MTIIFYLVTILAMYFGLEILIIGLFVSIFIMVGGYKLNDSVFANLKMVHGIFGGLVTFMVVNYLWKNIEGHNIPLILLIAWSVLIIRQFRPGFLLNQGAVDNALCSIISIVLFILYLLIFSTPLRWI